LDFIDEMNKRENEIMATSDRVSQSLVHPISLAQITYEATFSFLKKAGN
jgi:hypothetical protein